VAFEIVGEIKDVETFATGRGIRELPRLNRIYGRGRWRKRRGRPPFGFRMALSVSPNYTGTKQQASAARKSRSSSTWIDYG
jgi:hypothetical protein